MIICPNPDCKAQNNDGVLYCDQCGADLSQVERSEIPRIGVQPQPAKVQPPIVEQQAPATPIQPAAVSSPASATGILEPVQVQPPPVLVPQTAAKTAKLRVLRGEKPGEEFPIRFEGLHVIGRADPEGKPVDIDLTDQEASLPRPSVSRQHAAIRFENGQYTLEDLGSTNGTFVNRGNRLQLGVPQALNDGDETIVGRVYLMFILDA